MGILKEKAQVANLMLFATGFLFLSFLWLVHSLEPTYLNTEHHTPVLRTIPLWNQWKEQVPGLSKLLAVLFFGSLVPSKKQSICIALFLLIQLMITLADQRIPRQMVIWSLVFIQIKITPILLRQYRRSKDEKDR